MLLGVLPTCVHYRFIVFVPQVFVLALELIVVVVFVVLSVMDILADKLYYGADFFIFSLVISS